MTATFFLRGTENSTVSCHQWALRVRERQGGRNLTLHFGVIWSHTWLLRNSLWCAGGLRNKESEMPAMWVLWLIHYPRQQTEARTGQQWAREWTGGLMETRHCVLKRLWSGWGRMLGEKFWHSRLGGGGPSACLCHQGPGQPQVSCKRDSRDPAKQGRRSQVDTEWSQELPGWGRHGWKPNLWVSCWWKELQLHPGLQLGRNKLHLYAKIHSNSGFRTPFPKVGSVVSWGSYNFGGQKSWMLEMGHVVSTGIRHLLSGTAGKMPILFLVTW